jgi:hypothetical protein
MLIDHPELPKAYEVLSGNFRDHAEIFKGKIDAHDLPEMLSETEREFVSAAKEAIPQAMELSRLFMKLAALSQQILDERNGEDSFDF